MPVSSFRGTLGARLGILDPVPEEGASVATLSCISDAGRRKSHGAIGIESTFYVGATWGGYPSLMIFRSSDVNSLLEQSSVCIRWLSLARVEWVLWKDSPEGTKQ